MREVIPAVLLLALGTQTTFASFFISILVSGSKEYVTCAARESCGRDARPRKGCRAAAGRIQPHLATHDVNRLRSILATAAVAQDRYEIAMLHGIRSADMAALVAEGHQGNVLISYGSE